MNEPTAVKGVQLSADDTNDVRRQKFARIILDAMYQFLGLLDVDGTVLEINRAALEGAGIALDDVVGKPFWEARWWAVSEDAREQVRHMVAQARKGHFIRRDMEVFGDLHGEKSIVVDFSLTPIRDDQGQVAFLLPEGRNISEKVAIEAELTRKNGELQQALERLREIDGFKTKFFANVSHELRTPLTLILGPVEQLLKESRQLGERERMRLMTVQRHARSLLQQVNDLLDLARIDADKMPLAYVHTNVAWLLQEIAAGFMTKAEEQAIAFQVDCPTELWADVDRAKLARVVVNLLSNAFKFTPAGGRIRCSLHPVANDRMLLSVQDNGPGVPMALKDVIFARFAQAPTDVSSYGSGLGLNIVKEFVELHHGTVVVLDAAGGGAIFQVEMPILAPNGTFVRETTDHLAKNTLTNTVSAPRPMPNGVPVPHFPAPRLAHRAGLPHLLVVEDHQELLHFLHDVLVDDYNVTLAGDGAAALEAALACPPDLVITDLMMPQVDGMQLMQALRRMTQFEQVPAIVLTARADDAVRDNLLEECVQDYLTKPFSPQELRARVRNLITVKRSVELLQSELVRVSRFTAMGELAASIAHEVNQPLSAIATNSQAALRWMSRDTPNLPEVVAALNRVYRDANLAGDVIARIRNFLSRGGIKHERIAVQQILYDLLRMLHTLFQQASVEITVLVSPALPHLNADKVQLQQVLLNLIVNAVEAMREHSKGPRLLSISVTEQATQGMVFSVCDNGPGVPADIRPHLFEALFSTKSDGLGMGLAISRSIVENHGGWLRLDPNHSPGACFCFNIPLLP